MPRRGQMYTDDDFDDGYDGYDEEYYEEDGYGDWGDAPATQKPGSSKPGTQQAPAAAAGASSLARALCDPYPTTRNGKQQPGAKKETSAQAKAQQPYPVAPTPGFSKPASGASTANTAAAHKAFNFNTPSPDAAVLAARAKETTANTSSQSNNSVPKAANKLITLAPSKAMLAQNAAQKEQQQQAAARAAGGANAEAASAGLGGLSIQGSQSYGGEGSGSAMAKDSVSSRRRISEYVMEPSLARECDAAAAAETSGSAGGRQGLHLVVLGHVDAGKSTLMGRLLHDLGLVTSKEVHKNQRDAAAAGKASFSWAWLLDERPEERSRGVTVDVATTRFQTPKYNVTLLDAPGHRDFVPNMISGASQADAALLLVDGSPGGFESGFEGSGLPGAEYGQTREHAQLARSLGIEQVAVVVSKLDTTDYSQERFEYIQQQLLPFLLSCGFKERSIQWLPAVGPEGINLASPPPSSCPLASWWTGPYLVQAIDNFAARERLTGKPVRIPVTDVFKNKTGAMVVGGKLESGAVRPGMKLVVVPGLDQAAVKAVEVGGEARSVARAGDAVELSLSGSDLDVSRLPQGAVLSSVEFPVPCVTKFEARVLILDVPVPVLRGRPVTLHAHVARESGMISSLLSLLDARTGEVTKNKPRCLTKGQSGVIEVTADRSLCLEEYSDLKALGRITLRDGGRTIAVGVVTKILE